jgi:GNAT superfamily N-acetyltransferase
MDGFSIRPAVSSDIPALCKLFHAFHEFHAAGVPDRLRSLGPYEVYDATRLAHALLEILNDPDACLFVAEDKEWLVGFAEVYLRQDEPDPARVEYVYGHLQSLMVDAGWRRHGVGAGLVQAAEMWVKQKGASEMRLDTWTFSGDPVRFYEMLGYETLKRKLVRRLV